MGIDVPRRGERRVYGLDPGNVESAIVCWNGERVVDKLLAPNEEILAYLMGANPNFPLVIEKIVSFGMIVGASVFETVYFSGQCAATYRGMVHRITRNEVKVHLCRSAAAKDANISAAICDRFGGDRKTAKGTVKAPGPLFGFADDLWSALAICLTFWDTRMK